MQTNEQFEMFRPTWSSYFVFHTAAAMFVLAPLVNPQYAHYKVQAFIVAALILVFVVLRRYTTLYVWKRNGLVINNGIPAPKEREVPFENIRFVEDRRGLTQRALGIGNLALHLKAPPDEIQVLYGIHRPMELKRRLLAKMEEAGAASREGS